MVLSISGVVNALPRMHLHLMAVSWRKAVEILSDARLASEHAAATILLEAIHEEWDRRRAAPRAEDLAENWPEDDEGRRPHSPLSAHGYKVGRRSRLSTTLRQEILRRCIEEPLMPAFSPRVLGGWGPSRTPKRLKRVLELINDQIRNNFTQADKQDAVAEWRSDLRFLHGLYAERVAVAWPPMKDQRFHFVE